MKRLFSLFILLALVLSACAAAPAETEPQPTQTEPQPTQTETQAAPTETAATASVLTFSAEDAEGSIWTEQVFADHSLTILNFWEPWCGPCVSEMPDLQEISEEYADRGVLILGIYATPDAEDDVAAVLEKTGVTYPILRYTQDFDHLQTGYVPTTVIVDSTGAIVYGPFAGALNRDGWVSLIEKYL